jgi:hypothetical protein
LQEVSKKQAERDAARALELEEDFLIKKKEPKADENVMHVEDAIDMDKLKAHVNEIERCRPLKDNWVREVLSNNLRQVIKDIEEIKHIKSLPQNMEYSSPDENYQNLVIMSLTHEDRLLSVMDRKKNLMQRIRDKVVFRMRSAEE